MAFVGREVELAQLARALQRASEGEPTRVLVVGPAGVGVSRLIDELIARLGGLPDVLIGRGHAVEPMAGQPYAVLADALDGIFTALPDEHVAEAAGPAAHDLVALLPGLLARVDSLGVAHERPALSSRDQLGNRVTEGMLGAIERLSAYGVVLLVLEDLHWSDPATRGFIDALLRVSLPMPVCLIATYQPEALHRRHPARPFLDRFSASPDIERLALGPLTADEVTRLAEEEGGGTRPSSSFLAALMEGSGGNPLLATQLVRAHGALAGMRLSDPFEEVLGARLEALLPDALRAVRLLAAARRPLPAESLIQLPLREGRLDRTALDQAVVSGLAVETGGRIGIAHELYAEAIDLLALPPERHAMHDALASSPDVSVEEVAWHLTEASLPADARAAHLVAARAAERLDPGATALMHYHAALELGASPIDTPEAASELAEILTSAGRAAAAAGSFGRAAAFVKRAIEIASRRTAAVTGPGGSSDRAAVKQAQRERQARMGNLYERLGRYRWAAGDLVAGLEHMQRAVELVPAGPTEGRARALATLAQHLMLDGRFAESSEIAREACRTARDAGAASLEWLGHATCTLGVDLGYLGDLDGGLQLLEEATELAHRTGRVDDLMRAYANRTTLLDLDSRREQALEVVKDGIRDARTAGLGDTYGAFLRGNAADILFDLGRWAESETECRAGMTYRPAGVAWFSPILYLGLVLVESRADDEATRLVGQTLLQLEQVPAGQWTALALRSAVSLLLWRGEAADAVAVATREWDRVLETADAPQIAMAASTALEAAAALAEAGRQQRDLSAVAAAGELAARALGDAERAVAESGIATTLGARREAELHLETARAHLARSRGRSAPQRWARLAEAWSTIPVPYRQAKARWWQALASLQTAGDRRAARDALLEAWRISGELPSHPLRRALADLARRARITLPGATADELVPIATAPLVPVPRTPERAPGQAVSTETDGARATRPLVAVGPGRDEGSAEAPAPTIEERVGGAGGSDGTAFGLSPREFEVLMLLTEGRTNREIGERLFISDRTVGVHVRNILGKLGVSSRTQAAGTAIRLGLSPPGSSSATGPRDQPGA